MPISILLITGWLVLFGWFIVQVLQELWGQKKRNIRRYILFVVVTVIWWSVIALTGVDLRIFRKPEGLLWLCPIALFVFLFYVIVEAFSPPTKKSNLPRKPNSGEKEKEIGTEM